jgi:anthranilate phosphoribosyltransferase
VSANPIVSEALERLLAGGDLGREGAARVLEEVMAGEVAPVQTGAFLTALRAKGESAQEIAGLASVVRARASAVPHSVPDVLDTCGTGGGPSTFNISTTAAFVVAGAGVPVAKHGNRSVTSRCGSADVLEALGARLDLDPRSVGRCLEETGVCFMFAPAHHPAFAHVVPVRRALGVRTVFNILGPLTNPAGARRQVIGVYDPAYLDRVAAALAGLGAERALVVSGRDGLDEISTGAVTDVREVVDGRVEAAQIDTTRFGIPRPPSGALAGGGPAENAEVLRGVLDGRPGPAADVVLVNAGAALWLAGRAPDLEGGLDLARRSVRGGAAGERLEAFLAATARLAAPAVAG